MSNNLQSLCQVLVRVALSVLGGSVAYSVWMAVVILLRGPSGSIAAAVLWVIAPVATATGFAAGIAVYERLVHDTRTDFHRLLLWPLVGCSVGTVSVYWCGPMLIVFGMLAAGTGSVILREVILRRRQIRTVKPESFSYCGVDCSVCDVFKATVYGDTEVLKRAHGLWTKTARQHWGMETLDPAILKCRGCRTEGAEIFKGCRHCPMRRCAQEKGLASCGLCSEWAECERLSYLLADVPEARGNLKRIKSGSTTREQPFQGLKSFKGEVNLDIDLSVLRNRSHSAPSIAKRKGSYRPAKLRKYLAKENII